MPWDKPTEEQITATPCLLYIEPKEPKSEEPVVDTLTRRMTAAWRSRESLGFHWMGTHQCVCGVNSDNDDHMVGSRAFITNSLCLHYLAFHRDEVPIAVIQDILSLPDQEAEPTAEELCCEHYERQIQDTEFFGDDVEDFFSDSSTMFDSAGD